MKKEIRKTKNGNNITLYIYDDVVEAKGVVQIVHGASEHFTRYENFIKYLNEAGYICVGNDILGHGESTHADGNYILFQKDEAFESIVLSKEYCQENYKELPLYLLGHSMGSFLARKLLIDFKEDYSKAIISGTTTMPVLLTTAAKFLGFVTRIFRGKSGISPLLSSLGMGNLPVKMEKKGLLEKGEVWITHDKEIQKYYKESPICGEDFCVSSYQGMFDWIDYVSKKKNVKKGSKHIPIMFIAGSHDPLSNFGKDIKTTVDLYEKCGYDFISSTIYDDMRHEVLNEIDRDKVYKDCLDFFND